LMTSLASFVNDFISQFLFSFLLSLFTLKGELPKASYCSDCSRHRRRGSIMPLKSHSHTHSHTFTHTSRQISQDFGRLIELCLEFIQPHICPSSFYVWLWKAALFEVKHSRAGPKAFMNSKYTSLYSSFSNEKNFRSALKLVTFFRKPATTN